MQSFSIREYRDEDAGRLARLFYETVHVVNAADYTAEELEVWAPADADPEAWAAGFGGTLALVAQQGELLVGFANMAPGGLLDRLYVHHDYLRQGIASALCAALEASVPAPRYTTHASATALPFFLSQGYHLRRPNIVPLGDQLLRNFLLEKRAQIFPH